MQEDIKSRANRDEKCIKRARANGYLAGLKGIPREVNPHITTIPEFARAWDEGWNNAQEDVARDK